MKRVYTLCGMIAPIAYVFAVIIGGFLIKDYSHIYNSISELTASNVQKVPIIFVLFFLYNLTLIVFGVGLTKTASTLKAKTASWMLVVVGILGMGMLVYVQDPRHLAMTFGGTIHLVLAGLSSLLTMISIVLFGFSIKNDIIMKKFAIYSFISFGIIFITGGITAMSVANDLSFGGLFERITIGTFIQWVFVIAFKLHTEGKMNTYNSNKLQF